MQRRRRTFHHPAHQVALSLLQQRHPLLHGLGGQKPIDEHRPRLPDAMRPIHRLGFRCGVPPRIPQDHGIRRREIQTTPARLQAQQEHRHLTRLEPIDLRAPIHRVAGQEGMRNPHLLYVGGDQSEHRGELREDQHPAAFFDHLRQYLGQPGGLGRLHSQQVSFRQQSRIAAALAKPQERFQHHGPGTLDSHALHFLAHLPIGSRP